MTEGVHIQAGTVTVSNNSTAVVGVGTGWSASFIAEGDIFTADGLMGYVDSVASDTALTLKQGWVGASGGGKEYLIERRGDLNTLVESGAILREMLAKVDVGEATTLDGLTADKFLRSDSYSQMAAFLSIGNPAQKQFRIGYGTGSIKNIYMELFDGEALRRGTLQANSTNILLSRDGGANIGMYGANDARINGNKIFHEGSRDDLYESGSFTPLLYGTTTAGAPVYTYGLGEYYLVGDLCFVTITMGWTSLGGADGPMRLSGLPFTVKSGTGNRAGVTSGHYSSLDLPAGGEGIAKM